MRKNGECAEGKARGENYLLANNTSMWSLVMPLGIDAIIFFLVLLGSMIFILHMIDEKTSILHGKTGKLATTFEE